MYYQGTMKDTINSLLQIRSCFSLLAILLYRVPLTWSRWWSKVAHAGLLLVAIVLSLLGVIAAFDFHSANNIPHLYSLHSWTGISTVILFILQVQQITLTTNFRIGKAQLVR